MAYVSHLLLSNGIKEQFGYATTLNTNPTHKEKAQAGALINDVK
jgi:hypothetical protein